MDEAMLQNLESCSENEFVSAIQEFNKEHARTFFFPDFDMSVKKQLISLLFCRMAQSPATRVGSLETVRILSRDKIDLEGLFTREILGQLVNMAGLVAEEEEIMNQCSRVSDPKVIVEALKCLCNLIYNSSFVQKTCCLRTFCSSEFLFNSFVECTASLEVLTDGGHIQMDVIQGVTLLTASNWEVWKVEARVSLMHYGAWEFIEKKEERSPEEEAKLSWRDRSDLKLRKDRAFTLIYQSLSNEFKPLISGITDSAEAWKILREHFEPTTRARII
ncbi:synembryn-A [Trichonephila clavipes]|nr:synembryn-A [Trichonephila clavipes]